MFQIDDRVWYCLKVAIETREIKSSHEWQPLCGKSKDR